jgi:hypothetical protein
MVLRYSRDDSAKNRLRKKRPELINKYIIYQSGKAGRNHSPRARTPFPHRCLYVEVKSSETAPLLALQKELRNMHGYCYKIIKYKSEVLKLFPHFEIVRCGSIDQVVEYLSKAQEGEDAC